MLKRSDIRCVVYSNSNCSDLWPAFVGQYQKHCDLKLTAILDESSTEFKDFDVVLYKNTEPYWKQWVSTLENLDEEYVIYLQEDFFLFDDVHEEKIVEFANILEGEENLSFIRLIRTGRTAVINSGFRNQNLRLDLERNYIMQPTIWKRKDLIRLLRDASQVKWFECEKYKQVMKKLNIKGLYHWNNSPQRGGAHWDSETFPYVATALVKSKWNIREYPVIMPEILNKYNIDSTIRGHM